MRELGRVIVNEWMKLMRRRRLWITVLLAVLVVCGLSALSYQRHLDMMRWDSPEGLKRQIEQVDAITAVAVTLEVDLAIQRNPRRLTPFRAHQRSAGPEAGRTLQHANWSSPKLVML